MSKTYFNKSLANKRLKKALDVTQYALDNQILKDTNVYVPRDEGNLIRSSVIHSKIGEGEIIWNTDYARKVYYGTTLRFSKDRNPKATALWFDESKASNIKKWNDIAKKVFKGVF